MNRIGQKTSALSRIALWALVYALILSYVHPELVLVDTHPAGGDMTSHFPSAEYLRDVLLPQGRIVGWLPGNYAGFPLFQMYFPLPFLLMVLVGTVAPLTAAFKIVSLAGVLTLPPAAYYFVKKTGLPRPGPDLAAASVPLFLFMESNSAWGGNIPSTLAGEFCFGLGLSLCLVFLGRMYADVEEGRRPAVNALLLALVGFSHGYPLLFAVLAQTFFLITTRDWTARLAYILRVNLLAFCLMGFWIAPLLLYSPYTTAFNFVWVIESWAKVLPPIIQPAAILAAGGALWSLFSRRETEAGRRRTMFLLYLMLIAAVFYLTAFKVGMVDVRFIPFGQTALVCLGAATAGRMLTRLRAPHAAALAAALLIAAWTAQHEDFIDRWTEWNYSGLEVKHLWPEYQAVCSHLRDNPSAGRVVYEHSPRTDAVGSIRAFESLPYFAGRPTLEGVYIQASLNAPFVFYIQSQVSRRISAPLNQYNYSRFDLTEARKSLELFNVDRYIAVGEETRRAALAEPGYEPEMEAPPFYLFRLTGASGRYVVQPRFRPVLIENGDAKMDSFTWFRRTDLAVPLVFGRAGGREEDALFAAVLESGLGEDEAAALPRIPVAADPDLEEEIRRDEIIIRGASPGKPLWIRVSYHPRWKVEGADRVWRASPAFMLVFPRESRVRLYFGRSAPDYLGLALTALGLVWIAGLRSGARPLDRAVRLAARPAARVIGEHRAAALYAALTAAGTGVLVLIAAVSYQDPMVYYNRGLKYYNAEQYERSAAVFSEAARRFPLSPVIGQTLHHLGLSHFERGEYDLAAEVWSRVVEDYPEDRILPEALYHLGLSRLRAGRPGRAVEAWTVLRSRFPESPWAERAREAAE